MCDLCKPQTSKPVQGSPVGPSDAYDALNFANNSAGKSAQPSPVVARNGMVVVNGFDTKTVREAIKFAGALDSAILEAERQAAAYARDSRQALIGS